MSSSAAKKHYENGLKFFKSGKLAEAEASIAEAIALDEQQAEYWLKLGLIWTKQGRHAEAKDASQMAATLQPSNSDALFNLGLSHIQLGETDLGLAWIEKSFALSPRKDLAENLGDTFYHQGNYKLASYYYLKARQIDNSDPELQAKLATALYSDNDTIGAIILYIDLVSRYPTNRNYIGALVDMYRKFNHTSYDELSYKVLLICLKTENVKYRNLGPAWASMFMLDPKLAELRALGTDAPNLSSLESIKAQLDDEFLCIGLKNLPILNVEAEKILVGIRRYFMIHHGEAASWPKETLAFLNAMAVQSWYNDFVFFETSEETIALDQLTTQVKDFLASGKELSITEAILMSLYACYRPLYAIKTPGQKLPFSKGLLFEMKSLIKAQISNPEYETELIPTIPDFTEITDDVSRAVQAMYAQRPYPRWKSGSKNTLPPGVGELSKGLSILVAGCGTGQEPAMFGNSTPYAHTTAIDLSLPSIAYGKRMAEEMGFSSKIDFLHGDLMDVAKIGKKFDFIVSSGVLHHMKEPEKGWEAILNQLKPGGRMSISLYSKIARDYTLNPASEYIKEKGYTSSDADIRTFRHDVINLPDDHPARRCIRASDFFMLSECNDLLFHVQEHRYTCQTIKAAAEKLGLELFHVYMAPNNLKAWMQKHADKPQFDFDRLHEFEMENPDLFLEMYKMYFHRKGENTPHPLDPLIKSSVI